MSLPLSVCRAALCLCCLGLLGASAARGQTNYYSAYGTEYPVVGSLPGDQVWPDVALDSSGGFVVWQDNITDGSGWGLSTMRLDNTLTGISTFRVNAQGTNDQQYPRVALLKGGGAAFVWQGGRSGYEQIYTRFLSPSNTWQTTNDTLLSLALANTSVYTTNVSLIIITNIQYGHQVYITNRVTTITTNTVAGGGSFQINPALTVLNNSNVVVVWSSFDQFDTNSLLDVYGQILSPTGQKIGTNFLINQFTPYNQRTPAIVALKNGGFAVAWASEQERSVSPVLSSASDFVTPQTAPYPSIDIYARLFASNGVATTGEILVNADANPCGNPALACASDGSFLVTWSAFDMSSQVNGKDVYARPFSSTGTGGAVIRVNSNLPGDQYLPRISVIGGDYLITWTSLGQDGSREGVYGQFVHEDGSRVGGEFLVNTTTISQQMQPAVASDGASQFLVVWTSFTGDAVDSFDLYAQRYLNVNAILQPMSAPFVYAPFTLVNDVYQPQLQVSWTNLTGISVSNYEVYVDGAETPIVLTTDNVWTMTAANGLTANSSNYFQLDYVTTDGRRPLQKSPSASGKTWRGDYAGTSANAIPGEWMTMYFGSQVSSWPSTTADSDGDGLNNYQEFLAGTNPTNADSVLRVQIGHESQTPNSAGSPQGLYLSWDTQPGMTYQVQVTTDFKSWSNVEGPRFAAGTSDSIFVGGNPAGYYRVLLLRQ